MLKKVIISIVFGLFLCSFLGFSGAHAADPVGLAISPPLVEKNVKPGETYSGVIKVTNVTKQTLSVAVSKKYFTASGEGGEPSVQDVDNTAFSLNKWIDLADEFKLNADETKSLSYTINVPKNAEAGGHYSVVLFTPSVTGASSSTNGSAVSAVSQIGCLFLVSVSGEINYGANLLEFAPDKKLYVNTTNLIDIATRFQNLSTVHVKPQGNITVKNIFGQTVATLPVNEKLGNVLPDSVRKFENEWQKKYGFGPYRASVNLTYGEGKTLTGALSFWIIPWKETTGAIVLLALMVWLLSKLQWKKK